MPRKRKAEEVLDAVSVVVPFCDIFNVPLGSGDTENIGKKDSKEQRTGDAAVSDPRKWDIKAVGSWIRTLGIEKSFVSKTVKTMAEEGVNGAALMETFGLKSMEMMGIKTGPRLLIYNGLQKLKAQYPESK